MKRGVSPDRVREYVCKEFGENISQNKIYAFKKKVFPDVETVPMLDIIIPCEDDEEQQDISIIKEYLFKINIGLAKSISKDVAHGKTISGTDGQVYLGTLRYLLNNDEDNETIENLSDLITEDTMMMLNDRAKTE